MQNREGRLRQRATIRKVLLYIRKYWAFLILSLLLAVVTVFATLYLPILTGRVIDQILGPGQVDFAKISSILLGMGIVIGITALAQWLMNVCNNKITYGVVRDIRRDAFAKIEILPLKYIDGHSHGDLVSRVVADVDQFADGLLMGFTQLFTGVLTIVGTLGFMLSVHVGITLVVVLITPVSLFVASFIAKRTYTMFRKQSEARGEQPALIDLMRSIKSWNISLCAPPFSPPLPIHPPALSMAWFILVSVLWEAWWPLGEVLRWGSCPAS